MPTDVYLRMPPRHNTSVMARIGAHDIAILHRKPRRWWQIWKPKTIVTQLAQTHRDAAIASGDTVKLQAHGNRYLVAVNDQIVLMAPRPDMSDPAVTVIP